MVLGERRSWFPATATGRPGTAARARDRRRRSRSYCTTSPTARGSTGCRAARLITLPSSTTTQVQSADPTMLPGPDLRGQHGAVRRPSWPACRCRSSGRTRPTCTARSSSTTRSSPRPTSSSHPRLTPADDDPDYGKLHLRSTADQRCGRLRDTVRQHRSGAPRRTGRAGPVEPPLPASGPPARRVGPLPRPPVGVEEPRLLGVGVGAGVADAPAASAARLTAR